jgi:hypothetical protein
MCSLPAQAMRAYFPIGGSPFGFLVIGAVVGIIWLYL